MNACDACLRRAWLLQKLGRNIGRALDEPGRRAAGVLALGDEELIAAVARDRSDAVHAARDAFDPSAARHELERLEVQATCRHDDDYPLRLEDLRDPPTVLFWRSAPGRAQELLAKRAVAIVGARRCSTYAVEVAETLGRDLSSAGMTVVSGLALGVDAASHRGATTTTANAIAVLACGVENPYPRRHRTLYRELCARGAVVSELPPGTPPYRWSFPARNRIMAALAEMVIVVEAAESSGSLITTTFAADLGRDVAAVPGRVTHRIAAGSNRLLVDGARPIRSARDVLDHIYGVDVWPEAEPAPEPLEPELEAVLHALEVDDELGEVRGLSAREIRAALGRLEILGLVRRDGLGRYERTLA